MVRACCVFSVPMHPAVELIRNSFGGMRKLECIPVSGLCCIRRLKLVGRQENGRPESSFLPRRKLKCREVY